MSGIVADPKVMCLTYDEVLSGYQPGQMVLVRKYPEDEDRDGLRNVGLLTAQPFDPADSPRELYHTQSPGKQQISLLSTQFPSVLSA
jgi:hypothetical protein